jgi:hypothetical protein
VSYEWVRPVCGSPAEYNCTEDEVYCQARRNTRPEERIARALERLADAMEKKP